MANRSILRYPGGKFRARNLIANMFDESIKTVASPFFGGGSVELELADRGKVVYAAELFKPVAFLWQQVKENPSKLVRKVESFLGKDRSEFYSLQKELRNELDKEEPDSFKCAWMCFVINRTSFSGATLSGGIGDGKRFTKGSIEQILKVDLSSINIRQGDYWDVLFSRGQTYDAVYADPPYLVGSSLYGNKGNVHKEFDHERFATHIKGLNCYVVVSYNDCDAIRELFQGWRVETVKWSYGMNQSKKSNEILITNG